MKTEQTLITPNPAHKKVAEELIPTATIVFHPEIQRIGEEAPLTGLLKQFTQDISRLTPEFSPIAIKQSRNLGDPYISRKPLTLSTVNGGLLISKPAELTGVISINGRLLVNEMFLVSEEWRKGVVISLCNRIVLFIHRQAPRSANPSIKHGLLGESLETEKVRQAINRVSDLDVSVLIRGETGTGKELIAQAIHKSSQRNMQAFISVNVGAIPESLAISELFGTKKGAFTGAVKDRAGYFQQADKGSLFLDEVGDAPEQVQVALLRTLETGDITPVGSTGSIHVDVRLIAATDADLEKRISDDMFRSQLLQRLAGFEIRIPPLRKRREDIGRLFIVFLTNEFIKIGDTTHFENTPHKVSFWVTFFEKACLYNWPGNVRQLKNIAQQIAIYNREIEHLIIPDHITEMFMSQPSQAETSPRDELMENNVATPSTQENSDQEKSSRSTRRKPSTVTEQELIAALEIMRWDLKATADHLNISRAALYKIIDRTPSVLTAGNYSIEQLNTAYHKAGGNLDLMVDELKVSKAALKRRLRDLSLI